MSYPINKHINNLISSSLYPGQIIDLIQIHHKSFDCFNNIHSLYKLAKYAGRNHNIVENYRNKKMNLEYTIEKQFPIEFVQGWDIKKKHELLFQKIYESPELSIILSNIHQSLIHMDTFSLFLTIYSIGLLQINDNDLISNVLEKLNKNIEKFPYSMLYLIAWSLATLNIQHTLINTIFTNISRQIQKYSHVLRLEQVILTLWSFSIARHFDKKLFSSLVKRLYQFPLNNINPFQLSQLHQIQVGYYMFHKENILSEEYIQMVSPHFLSFHSPISAFRDEVSSSLIMLGVPHYTNLLITPLSYHIDILIRKNYLIPHLNNFVFKDEFLIELEEPIRYIYNTTRLNGSAQYKRWLLEQSGYNILELPQSQWDILTPQPFISPNMNHLQHLAQLLQCKLTWTQ